MADVAFSIGLHTDEAKAGRDAIVKWNAEIAGSYDAVLKSAKDAGAGLNLGAANGNTAGILGLEKAVNGLSASMEKLVQSQAAFIKSAQESVQSSAARTSASKAAAQAAESEAQAIDRITQRMRDAKAARDAQTQATQTQKAALDALNSSIAAGAGGQVSNAGLLATAKAAQDATVSVERLTKARLDDEAAANALVKSADTLVGRYAPMIKAQQQLANDRAALTKLQKEGTLTETEEAAVIAGLEAKQRNLDVMQKTLGGSTKAQAQHFQNLKYQINDVVTGLISGQPPMLVFTQQGGQIVQALQGMDISLKTVKASTLMTVGGIAAVTVAVGAGIVMYERYVGSLRDFNNANKLAGNSLGMTREQMAAYADTVAEASGVSSAFARETVTAYTKLGGISASVMSGLIGITKDYAAATGQSKDEAAAALGAMFSDPAKGAEQLAAKYNLLSGAQLDYIRRLAETGQKTQAQTVLTEALGQRIKGAAEETSFWARTWDAVGTAASNAATRIGRAIDEAANGMSLDRTLEQAEKRASELRARLSKETYKVPLFGEYEKGTGKAVDTRKDREELAQQDALIAKTRELITERNRFSAAQARDAQNNAAGRAALEVTNRYDDLGQAIRKAEGELATLQKGLGTNMGPAAAQGAKAVEALQNQIADLNKARGSGLDLATYKTQQLAAIDAKYAGQVGPQVAVQIAKEKERINVLGTATTAAQRKAQVDAATASAQAGVTQSMTEATMQLDLQTEAQDRLALAAGQGEAAQRRAAIENQVAAAAVKGLGDATRAALEQQEAATRQQIAADFAGSINLEVAANERLVAGMQKGAEATREAQIYNEAYAQTLRVAVPTEADFGKKLADNIALLERKAKALDSKAFEDYNKQLEGQTRQLQLQQKLVGATPQQAARLQTEHDINELLIKQGRNYENLTDGEKSIIDAARERSLQNADLEQQISRQKDAYDTIANSLEKSFERVGDALVNAFVEGKGSAVDFGNVAKGILSSLLTDLVKMSVVRPFSNAMFGTNYGTIFDLGGGSAANQNGGMGGLGGQALSLGSKFLPTGGITAAIDSWGYSALGLGTPLYGSAGLTSATGGLASSAGVAAVPGGVTNVAATPSVTGVSAGTGLSAYLGAAGIGFGVGSMLPSLLNIHSKLAGGAVGGLGGAGAGALAGTFLFPGVGTLLGAILGGGSGFLGGLLGTQKPSVGKTASSDVTISSNGKSATYGNILTDNEGDPEAGRALGQYISSIFTTAAAGGGKLTKDFGFGQTAKDGYYIAGSVDYKKFGDDFGAMMRYALIDQGGLKDGGKNTLAAITNSKNKDAEEFGKDVALGAGIDAGNTALKEMVKTLAGVTDAAKKATTDSFKPMFDELERAKKLGIDGAYKDLATDQLKAYLDQLRNPPDFTQVQTDMATLTGQFQAARDAYAQLNPAMVTYVDQIEKETRARVAANLNKSLDQQINEASGRGYVNQINGLMDNLSANARSLAAVGEPAAKANDLYNASLTSLLRTLTADQLGDVAKTFGGDIATLASTISAAATATQQATQFETLFGQIRQENINAEISALNEQKSAASSLLSSWKNLSSSIAQARQSLLVGDLSILDPKAKMEAALSAYRDAQAKAQGGDVDAAGQVSGLAQTALQAARAYYASNEDYARIFNEVSGGLGDVESVASRQVSLQSATVSRLDTLIGVQQDALRALNQPAQTDINSILSGLNAGNLGDLVQWGQRQGASVLQQVLQTADNRLGQAGNPYRYRAGADVQSIANHMGTQDYLDVGKTIGFSGSIDQLNPWIVAYGKQSAFEGAVKAWGSAHGYQEGGIVRNGLWGVDSVMAKLAGGEGVLTAPATAAIGAGAVDYINRYHALPANDRWAAPNVLPFRNGGGGAASMGGVEARLDAANQRIEKLTNTVEYLCSVIAEGERENIKATKEGNAAAKQTASAAVRQRARG